MSSSDHDESQRMLRQAALLGEQNLNRLDKWRLCNARAEEERASKRRTEDRKREREQERERNEVEALRAELRQAVVDLRGEIEQRHEVTIEAVLATVEQAARFATDAWDEPIREWLGDRIDVSLSEVLEGALGLDVKHWSQVVQKRVVGILTGMSFEKYRPRTPEGRAYRYRRDPPRKKE